MVSQPPSGCLCSLLITSKIPTLASCSFDEIVDAAQPGQVQFLQLYVNKDRQITERFVRHAEARGIKGLFITVDAPQLGRREKVSAFAPAISEYTVTTAPANLIGHASKV